MSRKKTIKLSCINLVTHPHSPENYIKLFNSIHSLRKDVAIGHRRKMIMGSLHTENFQKHDVLYGLLYKFDDIDEHTVWYNTIENSQASDEDMGQLQIPDHLRPNLTTHRFLFFPKGHKLFIETKSEKANQNLSIYQAQKYFELICNNSNIVENFGEVSLTIEMDQEQLEAMLRRKDIIELSYEIHLPNPDIDGDESFTARMQRRGVLKETRQFRAISGESLRLDDEILEASREASSNGYVSTKNRIDHRVESMSSKEHPLSERVSFDPSTESPQDSFWRKSFITFQRIIGRQ